MPYQGEIAAICAAALWAIASLLYLRLPWNAWHLATVKNCLATVMLLLVLGGLWVVAGRPVSLASDYQWSMLGMSAIVGLALGDTAYFRSLQVLGARRALTLTLLTPPITAWMAYACLHEVLPPSIWAAMAIILAGVLLVVLEGTRFPEQASHVEASAGQGIACAALGILGQSSSCILIKVGSQELPSLEATIIRLIVASACGIVVSYCCGRRSWIDLRRAANWRALGQIMQATFVGTVLGVWLMLIAFQQAAAGVAATLTSLSPVFVLPLVICVLRQKVSWRGICGAIVAVLGVCWLFFGDAHL